MASPRCVGCQAPRPSSPCAQTTAESPCARRKEGGQGLEARTAPSGAAAIGSHVVTVVVWCSNFGPSMSTSVPKKPAGTKRSALGTVNSGQYSSSTSQRRKSAHPNISFRPWPSAHHCPSSRQWATPRPPAGRVPRAQPMRKAAPRSGQGGSNESIRAELGGSGCAHQVLLITHWIVGCTSALPPSGVRQAAATPCSSNAHWSRVWPRE
mmetsp:Transcript_22002/g.57932  ORF Transcript_22002/g.57932 Transcript_22002/m.57932 type:complete len:209 (-) Transcript_22002:35-661(-)